jgi:hypothetical protein
MSLTVIRGTDEALDVVIDAMASLDGARRTLHTESGRTLRYDALLLAVGAFNGLLEELERGRVRGVAFALHSSVRWPLPLYEPGGQKETVHFTGRARLSQAPLPAPPEGDSPSADAREGGEVDRDAVYRVYFHGPAYQVLERAWCSNGDIVGRLAPDLPPAHEPPAQPTEIAPRLTELCFQTAGGGELGMLGCAGLPTHVDWVVRFKATDERGQLFAVVHRRDGEGVDPEVVDKSRKVRVRLEGYMTTALPGGLDPEAFDPIRAAMG